MTSQFDFSADDWDHVASTPLLVGFAVAKAEDSGFLGSLREMKTLISTIAAGAEESSAGSLINQAAATEPKAKTRVYRATGPAELAEAAVSACQELSAVLSAKTDPDEAAGYKRWVLDIAHGVAEAATEGGVRVSPPEVALIERIESALALS